MERVLLTLIPHKFHFICSAKREMILLLGIVLLVLALHVHGLFTLGLQDVGPSSMCYGKSEHNWYYTKLQNKLSGTLDSFAPFAIILICNLIIIYSVFRANRKRKDQTLGSQTTIDRQANSLLRMLLAVSFAFLLLRTPLAVAFNSLSTREQILKFLLFDTPLSLTFYLLNSLNFAINFFLYLASGTTFRQELVSVMCCKRHDPTANTSITKARTSMSEANFHI